MRQASGPIVVKALEDEGIRFCFGIPGTHNIELYDAIAESETVVPILVTDEQGASFMADGVWRASGEMGCVNVVPGAGLTHALSGIAEAYMDNVPMLVLGCGIRRDSGMAYQLHDIDQAAIVDPVVKGTFRPATADEVYPTIRSACQLARTGAPGPVFVEIPANLYVLKQEVDEEKAFAPPMPLPGLHSGRGAYPEATEVARAVAILRAAKRPLLYIGAGASVAASLVRELAERLEAPVSTTFQGKGIFPEDHPLFLWPGFGTAAPAFVRKIADGCDAVLAIGCRFSEVGTGSFGFSMPGPLIHVDIDPEVPGRNYPAVVPIVADAEAFLTALLDRMDEKRPQDPGLRDRIRSGHEDVKSEWDAKSGGELVTPYHLLRVLQAELGPEAVYTTDSGNGTFLAMEGLRLTQPGKFLAPVDYSCMGYAVPAAIGAKLARPECPVVALAGDGAFLMTGLEAMTGVAHGVGVIVLVLRDRELAQIAQLQGTALNRKVASRLPEYDVEALADAVGAGFVRMRSDAEVEDGVRAARAIAERGLPVLVDVAIDYSEKTYFTRGVIKANFSRLPLRERVRYVGRAVTRRFTEPASPQASGPATAAKAPAIDSPRAVLISELHDQFWSDEYYRAAQSLKSWRGGHPEDWASRLFSSLEGEGEVSSDEAAQATEANSARRFVKSCFRKTQQLCSRGFLTEGDLIEHLTMPQRLETLFEIIEPFEVARDPDYKRGMFDFYDKLHGSALERPQR